MSLQAYLEASSLYQLERRKAATPSEAVAFIGVPRKHPYDEGKLILFCDPLGDRPRITEFKVADILDAEDVAQPVTEKGESLPLVRLWVRKGAWGIQYDPFEVDDPPHFAQDSASLREALNQSLFRGTHP